VTGCPTHAGVANKTDNIKPKDTLTCIQTKTKATFDPPYDIHHGNEIGLFLQPRSDKGQPY